MAQRFGIFGGSFNPIHNAHLIMAERFCDQFALDKCFFVPANISPFKVNRFDVVTVSPEDRLEMLWLAIEDNDRFETDVFEIDKSDVSYTYLTVEHFKDIYPAADFFLMIGSDHAYFFKKWINWVSIINNVQICIAPRTILTLQEKSIINKDLTHHNRKPKWLDSSLFDISSSDIRFRLKRGLSIRYLVPQKVLDFIKTKNLYL